jgi:hypothetical protein
MSESLWNDIDERLRSQLDAYMGRASAFPTLKLQTVDASILTDLLQMDWKKREFPFGIVDGRVEEMNLREHGDDLFSANGESRYKYFHRLRSDGLTRGGNQRRKNPGRTCA